MRVSAVQLLAEVKESIHKASFRAQIVLAARTRTQHVSHVSEEHDGYLSTPTVTIAARSSISQCIKSYAVLGP